MKLLKTVLVVFVSVVGAVAGGTESSHAQADRQTDAQTDEAFSVHPMEMKFSLDSKASMSSKLRLKNQSESQLRIRIDVFERSNELDGSERRSPTKNLKVSEREFDLLPSGEKTIDVSYLGPRTLKSERAYRVVVKQVDGARAAETGASLDLRFVYVASVYVSPQNAEPRLRVERVRRLDEKKVEIEFANKGTAHQKLSDVRFSIRQTASEGERPLKKAELAISDKSRRELSRLNILARGRLRTVLEVAPEETLIDGSKLDVSF